MWYLWEGVWWSCSHCRAGSMAEVCVCQAGVRTRSGQVQGPSAGPQLMLPVLIKFRGFVRPCLVTLAGYEDSKCAGIYLRDVMNMVFFKSHVLCSFSWERVFFTLPLILCLKPFFTGLPFSLSLSLSPSISLLHPPSQQKLVATIGVILRADTNSLGTCVALTSIGHFLWQAGGLEAAAALHTAGLTAVTNQTDLLLIIILNF